MHLRLTRRTTTEQTYINENKINEIDLCHAAIYISQAYIGLPNKTLVLFFFCVWICSHDRFLNCKTESTYEKIILNVFLVLDRRLKRSTSTDHHIQMSRPARRQTCQMTNLVFTLLSDLLFLIKHTLSTTLHQLHREVTFRRCFIDSTQIMIQISFV